MKDEMRDNPLWVAYRMADKIYGAASKSYCAEFKRLEAEARREIQDRLRDTRFGVAVRESAVTVKTAFDAYYGVYGIHPPEEK